MIHPKKTVFRLRGCPGDLNEGSLRELLSSVLGGIATSDINVQSLAKGHGLDITSKTATLMFNRIPAYLQDRSDQTSWQISLDGALESQNVQRLCKTIVLDIHFEGFTPLNDVDDGAEAVEYEIPLQVSAPFLM